MLMATPQGRRRGTTPKKHQNLSILALISSCTQHCQLIERARQATVRCTDTDFTRPRHGDPVRGPEPWGIIVKSGDSIWRVTPYGRYGESHSTPYSHDLASEPAPPAPGPGLRATQSDSAAALTGGK